MTMETNNDVLAVVVTALEKERDAVLRHLPAPRETSMRRRVVHRSTLQRSDSATPRDIVVVCLHNMGNIHSAIAIEQAIAVWNPRNILLTGIAGGLKDGSNRYLGDVIVAEQVVDYELAKQEADGARRRYQVYRPAKPLLDAARMLPAERWALSVKIARPDGTTGRTIPRVHFGVVASGQKVVKDPSLTSELKEDWAQLIGIEMEAAGAAAAAYESGTQPGILLVKSICDWADPGKDDAWQDYAADAAATFATSLLASLVTEEDNVTSIRRNKRKAYGGQTKIAICGRMNQSWQDLADYFEIRASDRARFERGREPQGVWEWLEARNRLSDLKDALNFVGREDLALEL
ncbi:hypothetical protein ACMHYB_48340 [Sorangium sp. So ce1128]